MAKKQYYYDANDCASEAAMHLCAAFMSGELTLAQLEIEIAAEMRQLIEETPMSEG